MKVARTVSSLSLVRAATVRDRYAQAAPIQPTAEMTCTVSRALRNRRPSILDRRDSSLAAPRRSRLSLELGPQSAEDQCEDVSEKRLRRGLFVHQALERQAMAQGPHRPRQVARIDR